MKRLMILLIGLEAVAIYLMIRELDKTDHIAILQQSRIADLENLVGVNESEIDEAEAEVGKTGQQHFRMGDYSISEVAVELFLSKDDGAHWNGEKMINQELQFQQATRLAEGNLTNPNYDRAEPATEEATDDITNEAVINTLVRDRGYSEDDANKLVEGE